MERLAAEKQLSFGLEELLVLADLREAKSIPPSLRPYLAKLSELGAIEKVGRGKYVLAKTFYKMAGRSGEYTRKRGLDRETNKALLLKHIRESHPKGATANEFGQVLPAQSRDQISALLKDLKDEGSVRVEGKTRAARWFSVVKTGEPRSET